MADGSVEQDGEMTRRDLVMASAKAAGGAAIASLVPAASKARTGDEMNDGETLERTTVALGFIPLTDCAPLVVAREKGFFGKHGLTVHLSREPSWANIRDKVALGVLDGAQMLAAIPIASTLGIGAVQKPMVTALSLGLNGNAITVSDGLYMRMLENGARTDIGGPLSAHSLKTVIEQDRAAGKPPMTFAVVFPTSMHNYQLRYWMGTAGINPDHDVRIVVVPPADMVSHLEAGHIDGYCVGEPWNEAAVARGLGHVAVTGYDVWNNAPEKVFGVTRDWADKFPNTHQALLRALIEAARWADLPENRMEVVRLISAADYVDAPAEVVRMPMTGSYRYSAGQQPRPLPDFNVFYRYAATFPWHSHAIWLMTQMARWGQLPLSVDMATIAAQVYRPDLYRMAATTVGAPYPHIDMKTEGGNTEPWTLSEATQDIPMGADAFIDGRSFDPMQTQAYLNAFEDFKLAGGQLPASLSSDGNA